MHGHTPEPFRENLGTQMQKTRSQMEIVPRMILILKWDPLSVSPIIQLSQTQTRLLTETKKPQTDQSATQRPAVLPQDIIIDLQLYWPFTKNCQQR